ncbi:MAG: hypothetical protein Kow0026_03240 [Oricola sp.]
MLQVFLTLAPVDAFADSFGFENVTAASPLATTESGGFVLSGSDPVREAIEQTFESGDIFFVRPEDGEADIERNSVTLVANAPADTGTFARFYRTRAPPLSSFS